MPDAKGFFPEDHPQYIGIDWGPVGQRRRGNDQGQNRRRSQV